MSSIGELEQRALARLIEYRNDERVFAAGADVQAMETLVELGLAVRLYLCQDQGPEQRMGYYKLSPLGLQITCLAKAVEE
jgi:hypothetical protein